MPDFSHTILFAAVLGAVKNALDGHPDWVVPKDFARSVAKRAAGTLAAFAPAPVLVAARRSGKRAARVTRSARRRLLKPAQDGVCSGHRFEKGAVSCTAPAFPGETP